MVDRRQLTERRGSDTDAHVRRWRRRAAASTVRCPARRHSLRTRPAVAPSPPSRRYSTVRAHTIRAQITLAPLKLYNRRLKTAIWPRNIRYGATDTTAWSVTMLADENSR